MSFVTLALAVVAMRLAADPYVYPTDLAKWVEFTVPQRHSADGERLFRTGWTPTPEWVVGTEGGRVLVRRQRDLKAPPLPEFLRGVKALTLLRQGERRVERAGDGWLVADNAGEWGGAVWWFAADGKKGYEVSTHQVNQFVRVNDDLYAVEGLSHLAPSYGSVIRFEVVADKWTAKEVAKLPSEGRAAAAAPDGTLVVATMTGLVRVTTTGKVEPLVDDDWMEYPNSVVLGPGGVVYVGMRPYVGVYDPSDKVRKWKLLIPRPGFLTPSK